MVLAACVRWLACGLRVCRVLYVCDWVWVCSACEVYLSLFRVVFACGAFVVLVGYFDCVYLGLVYFAFMGFDLIGYDDLGVWDCLVAFVLCVCYSGLVDCLARLGVASLLCYFFVL